jgi:hypothetical protein
MSDLEQHATLHVLWDFLAEDHTFPYYSARDAIQPAYKVLDDILSAEEILYVWAEVENDTTGEEAGLIHVLTRELHISATYKRGEGSTASLRPLHITGLDFAPVYKEQYGTTYVMRYTVKIHRRDDFPLELIAKYATNQVLTTKLHEAFRVLRSTLGAKAH